MAEENSSKGCEGLIKVFIGKATNLKNKDFTGKSDPYVTLELNDRIKFKTKTITDSLNPEWNHSALIGFHHKPKTIRISVWDLDFAKSDESLGYVEFDVEKDLKEPSEGVFTLYSATKKKKMEGRTIEIGLSIIMPEERMKMMENGTKKALLVGILYKKSDKEQNHLDGCIADAKRMKEFLKKRGYNEENIKLISDEETDPEKNASTDNIEKQMAWLVEGAKPGDTFFFYFSGHGIQTEDDDDGEEEDNFDEAIMTIGPDGKTSAIRDDTMNEVMLQNLPVGARMVSVMDCCHSGTALDLPILHRFSLEEKKKIEKSSKSGTAESGDATCEVLLLSGCTDKQLSQDAQFTDGGAGGALTSTFLETIEST
mmetsp:Transcript_29482/g.32802  ORF Transcript_29482/g.32802 Transcript_29482/m.32802 type:complete len:369 (+) Transcript_29482:38-1144(+)